MDEEMSPKAAAFLAELETLCRKHGVGLSPSGYDSLQLWDISALQEPIYAAGIDDMTND